MKKIIGNIWNYHKDGNWIVIPTNGEVKKNGEAVMGKGLAKQAAERFPTLPLRLARMLESGNFTYWYPDLHLITFPTKERWRDRSSLELIKLSLHGLWPWLGLDDQIYLPRVGCGNGGLSWEKEVKPLLEKYLDDRFVVIHDRNRRE